MMRNVISPDALSFLKRLKEHNNRKWFQDHKQEFKAIQEHINSFFYEIGEELQRFDAVEPVKIFRIYRDVRFSKDKTPYKTHFSASYQRASTLNRGTYYLQINPQDAFVAAGFYKPEKEDLLRIRQEFEFDDQPFREILSSRLIKKQFPQGLQGAELKTAPRGYDKHHKAIDLLRKKQFYFSRLFNEEEILAEQFGEKVLNVFKDSLPFLNYMTEVLTTNLNGESIY